MDSKRTLRPLLLAGAVALASVVTVHSALAERAHGGPGNHGGPDPEQRLERMTEQLGLEDDQVALVREVLEDSRTQAQAVLSAQAGERRAAMETLRAETDARLAGILTPAQMQLLEEARADRGERRAGRREARRDGRFEHIAARLELADSQVEPVRAILDASRARGRALMQDARGEGLPREAVRARMDALRTETRAELEAVLTPAQLESFLALREAHGEGGPRRRHGRGPQSR